MLRGSGDSPQIKRPVKDVIGGAGTEVFDVTGAGDTVAAVLACCLAAGASLELAARLAARAAAASVARAGASAARPDDLLDG